ncbi:amiloride-sensitive sodium channel subunit gamma-like [Brachionus plicatilis]|uniref:Amiloride-sensitive sodium channel subunit gamma-like n=1 Tax=Brachionus plicatilis TaxID=10195 RepID=A0A3M7SSJ8_BRAPC|nr:amiloride-sensitive sodium channel subunit gamma-like [Brachionus plicatilis]
MEKTSKKILIKKIIKESILSSTGHGFPNIIRSEKWPFKILWILSTLVSIGLCSLLIIQSILLYFSYEVTTKIRVISEFKSEFPTITVCNINFFTTQLITDTFGSDFNSTPDDFFFDLGFRDKIPKNLDLKLFGDSKEKLIKTAKESIYSINMSQIKYFYHPEHGNCYQINSGFDQNGHQVPLITFLRPGRIAAISLILNVSLHQELRKHNMNMAGIIFIHNKTQSPLSVDGVIVSPGFITNIGLMRTFSHQKPKPYSSCDGSVDKMENYDSNLYKLILAKTKFYHRKVCIDLCYQEQLIIKCNCTDSVVESVFEHNHCQFDDVCLNEVYDYTFKNVDKICYSKCPFECDKFVYTKMISINKFGEEWKKSYETFYGLENRTIGDELAVVRIYYEALDFTEITETPTLSIVSLIANIGGVIGLFLGLSVLSFVEVIDIIIQILSLFFNKKINLVALIN